MTLVRCSTPILLLAVLAAPTSAQQPDLRPAEIVGAYRSAAGGLFLVGSSSAEEIRVRDLEGGLRGQFVRTAPDRFEQDGSAVGVVRENGRLVGLEIVTPNEAPRTVRRVPLRFEEVQWESDATVLSGTLVLPAGDGPSPGLPVSGQRQGALPQFQVFLVSAMPGRREGVPVSRAATPPAPAGPIRP